ncbi:MAG TPA: protein kinase [Pyrinomonadaceae bacterium]
MSKLGAGGMGEVYLAQDTKLDRKVALKILPADVAANKNRMDRFVREAKSAAALNHPNIAHVYEIGESDGTHFIAMEYIDGETLRVKIHRDKTPLSKLLKYLTQVAQGLFKAHAAGIVHRDLKPENIMVTRDDYAKVLDFGLAKLIEGWGETATGGVGEDDPTIALSPRRPVSPSLSTPGIVMGTVGYMSPEQASGRISEIDHRSDIFSFGCILFEAATGKRAFEGKDALDSLHKIVHAPTPQLKDVNPLAPFELQRVVRRCLAKEPEKRYQSIKELAIELDDLQEELKGVTASNYSASQASPTIQTTSGASRTDEGFWVAVLPFKVRDDDPAVATLADGLSEEIVTGLSRFRYLSVVTSASAARLTGDSKAERAKLGTRYVLEGSIRKAGSAIRVSVQLVDTETGAQLWSETYNRDIQISTIFDVQDDVAARIVATAADSYGVLVHSMRDAIRQKNDADLTPAEWQFQYFAYREQITPSNHAALKMRLERAAKSDNRPSDLWACLAQVYLDEYAFGFPGDDGTSLDRALVAARRAVEMDRANQFAMVALAQTHFFRQDLAAFGPAAERAMALNPLNTDALGILGLEIVHTAEFERGTAIVRRAMELNPNHAGWMHFAPLWDHFHKGEYEQALECANRVDVPGLFWPYLVMASACGHLGRSTEAEAAVRDLLALDPEFAKHARSNVGTWHFASGLMDPILEGLRKAGLDISDEAPASTSSVRSLASSETRTDEGFWVAVLPFKFTDSNTEVATLAEGLSEEIVTGLCRFSYLRVISRSSTLRYARETDDVRDVGTTLGARYVMEGSLRIAGSSLRISVQLVDAGTGAHLWAETYDRQFRAEEVFALQDDLVPRIVSTVADVNGVLPRSMCDVVCNKNPDELSPYEAVLRSFRYFDRVNAEELATAQSCLEIAVKKAPTYADAWAMLALLFAQDYGQGFNLRSDALNSGTVAAQRAVEAGPSNHLAYFSLAQAHFFQKDRQSFRIAAERAVALNPMDANSLAFMGELLTYVGDSERGLALATRAKQINPNHPGWFWYADFFHAYRQGDYGGALSFILKANLPGHWGMHAGIAAANGQLGDLEAASKAIRDLLKLRPNYGATVRNTLAKWFDAELCEQLLDGLRKAGLEIAGEKPSVHQSSSESRTDEGFWIAVLPFKVVGTGTELESLALGMTEEIVTGFSRFSYLRVMSLGSTKKHPQSGDLRQIGAELGARYVMEGSIRQAGSTVRLAVRLVDTSNGAHLWAETFDRNFQPDQIFAMQDELIPRIVSTCADHFGVLARSISDAIRGKDSSQLSSYEALMRGFGYHYRLNPQEHAAAREILEQAVKDAPNNADCWAMLSWVYSHEYGHGFNPQPGSLDRALDAARRAVDLAPTNHLAYQTLAVALFFRKERTNCLSAAERALALNPLDASNEAIFLITFVDDWDRGCSLIKRAMDLNPYVPGWYRVILALNEYRKANYREAVGETVKASAPGIWTDIVLSAAYAQLGEQAAARNALNNLISENSAHSVLNLLTKWFDAELVEHLTEGLCKAGLEIAADQSRPTSVAQVEPPSVTRSSFDAPAIAVLPFNNLSDDPEQEYFADGLAEDLITRLSLWRSFPVIARNSSFPYKGNSIDLKKVSSELGVLYVVQGSVRKSGNQVRISAQLIDSTTGQNVWAKTFDRELTDVFGVQDEISEAIATSLVGDLERAEHSRVQRRAPESLEAWGLYQRALPLIYNFTREDSAQAGTLLARAVEHDPHFATALARLAEVGTWEVLFEWADDSEQTLAAAIAEARRAVALDPLDAQARIALSFALMTAGDGHGALEESRQAVALNPSMPFALAIHAYHRHIAGHPPEESIGLVQRALRLSPHDPVEWLFYDVLSGAYLNAGRFDEGLEAGRRLIVLSPNYYWGYLWSAMNEVGLGRIEEARELVAQARRVKPELSFELARKCLGTMAPDVDRRFLAALRQAGLEDKQEEIRAAG